MSVQKALTLQPRICFVCVHFPKIEHSNFNKIVYYCYKPRNHHMYTMMDCDFLETEFYYSIQSTNHRDNLSRPLYWLISTVWRKTGLAEHVDGTTDTLNPIVLSHEDLDISTPTNIHEVIC